MFFLILHILVYNYLPSSTLLWTQAAANLSRTAFHVVFLYEINYESQVPVTNLKKVLNCFYVSTLDFFKWKIMEYFHALSLTSLVVGFGKNIEVKYLGNKIVVFCGRLL